LGAFVEAGRLKPKRFQQRFGYFAAEGKVTRAGARNTPHTEGQKHAPQSLLRRGEHYFFRYLTMARMVLVMVISVENTLVEPTSA